MKKLLCVLLSVCLLLPVSFAAAEAGETEIWIDVPISGDQGNWPHNGNIGKPMGYFFLKYGIIDHEMIVHVHRSEDFNREFLIPLPQE